MHLLIAAAAFVLGAPGTPGQDPDRVWVDYVSRDYFCPGASAYGRTAKGAYMREDVARQRGYRSASGKRCVGALPYAAYAAPNTKGLLVEPRRVWVEDGTRLYYCVTKGSGRTTRGYYTDEVAAIKAGVKSASGRACP